MKHSFLVILFLVGFFAGLAFGAFWGVTTGLRELSGRMDELRSGQSAMMAEMSIIKAKVSQ